MEGPEAFAKVPSLLVLAALSVAEHILHGKYNNVDYDLTERQSNIVFDVIKEADMTEKPVAVRLHDVLLNRLHPSKILISRHIYRIGREPNVPLIKKQYLTELTLGNVEEFKYCFASDLARPPRKRARMEEDRTKFDIVALLDKCLRSETKRKLEKLDLSKFPSASVTFKEDWVQAMARQLRSLKVLNLVGNQITNTEFVTLCENFPHLRTLNVCWTGVSNLSGISNLVVLSDLTIGSGEFRNPSDIEDIFNLKCLKKLALMCSTDMTNTLAPLFFNIDKTIPTLEELQLFRTEVTLIDLRTIVRRNQNLEKIVAFVIGYREDVFQPLNECCKKLAIEFFKHYYEDSDRMLLVKSTLRLSRWNRATGFSPTIDWKEFLELLKRTYGRPIDEIVSEAMKFLKSMIGKTDLLYNMQTIYFFVDKIDSRSKYYEDVDKYEMIECMKKLQEKYRTDVDKNRDTEHLIAELLKFLERDFK